MIEVILVQQSSFDEHNTPDGYSTSDGHSAIDGQSSSCPDEVNAAPTPQEHERLKRLARGLFGTIREVDGIFTPRSSSAIRAAEAIAALFSRPIEIFETSHEDTSAVYEALIPTRGRHLILTEDPALRRLVGKLCGISEFVLEPLQRGGAISIKKDVMDQWRVSWMLQPRHLRSIGSSLMKLSFDSPESFRIPSPSMRNVIHNGRL